MSKKNIKIKFEYSSRESTEYTINSLKRALRNIIGEKCIIKITNEEQMNGIIFIKTDRSKSEILKSLRAKESGYDVSLLDEWSFS